MILIKMLTFIAAMSLSYDSMIFVINSSRALLLSLRVPFIVMVLSRLYTVRSRRLERRMEGSVRGYIM